MWISESVHLSIQVVEAAKQRSDILVQVGLEYRYMPPVAKLIDTVKSGTLGKSEWWQSVNTGFLSLLRYKDPRL